MLHFECDYLEGAHPRILERLAATNLDQTPGYGKDAHTTRACELIREACAAPDAEVWLLVGGTQTNATVIRSVLRNYEGVISPESGHITGHEAGAIEATGHKVITVPAVAGKLTVEGIESAWSKYANDHSPDFLVRPGMVYLSQPTELGTLYSLAELEAISAACKRLGLPLFIDGARLGYGLASPACDMTLADVARLADVFYIGGTKVGAMFGEAVVITNPAIMPHFRSTMKQAGAVLAKGRMLGIQFEVLFEDGLYMEVSRHAGRAAERIQNAFIRAGLSVPEPSSTNQVFVEVDEATMKRLESVCTFTHWAAKPDGRHVLRFVTSWATKPEDVDALVAAL